MPECPGALQYAQMRDGRMIRLRFPGGELTSSQLHCLARLSQENGNGLLDLTNRANLQIRGLHSLSQDWLTDLLQQENILADALWADRLRNIMADPLREKTDNGITDTSGLARQLDKLLQQTASLKDMSAKFCFIIDNGSSFHIAGQPHDLALTAINKRNALRYRLSVAGTPMDLSVSPHEVAPFLVKIAKYICRSHHAPKRGADILRRLGKEKLASEIRKFFPTCHEDTEPVPQQQATTPPIGIISQHDPALTSIGLGVPVSRLSAKQLALLGDWAKIYGNGTVRLSPWQIIYITDIPKQDSAEVSRLAENHGFVTGSAFLQAQVYACSGSSGCPRTEAACKEDGRALSKRLNALRLQDTLAAPVKVHLSGCKRGCGFGKKADIVALAQTDGSGYRLYRNKAVQDIPDLPAPKNLPLHTDIIGAVMSQLKNRDKV